MTVDPRLDATRDFDAAAPTWDEAPRRVQLARDVAAAMLRAIPFRSDMNVLDYGCGTGLVTLHLRPHVARITGADTSRGMLDVLAGKVRDLGLDGVETHLLDSATPWPGRFHAVVSSMTLHHVEHLEPLFQAFHDHLEPGGYVALADLDTEDGTFHENPAGVFHQGFERPLVLDLLVRAGFVEASASTAATVPKGDHAYSVFLACARRDRD